MEISQGFLIFDEKVYVWKILREKIGREKKKGREGGARVLGGGKIARLHRRISHNLFGLIPQLSFLKVIL